jgi:hypothetical protein
MEKFLILLLILNVVIELIMKPRRHNKIYFAPFLVPLGIGAAQGIGQLLQARKQKKLAKDAMNFMPGGLTEATNMAQAQSNSQRYAGQDADESNIRQNTADTFSNVAKSTNSTGTLLNAASRLNAAQGNAMNTVAQRAANFRENAMDKYRNLLLQKANVQTSNQQYSEALKGSATQNKYNALNSMLGGIAAAPFAGGGGRNSKLGPFGQFLNNSGIMGYNPYNPYASLFGK